MAEHWIDIHRELGCEGCKFCDYEAYGHDACCTYPGRIQVEDETGHCLTRRPEEVSTDGA